MFFKVRMFLHHVESETGVVMSEMAVQSINRNI